jgi:hypothetical protein
LAGLVSAVVLALSDSVAATGDQTGAAAGVAPLPQREVMPLLQAWRRAEACAAAIPGGEALVGRGDSMLPVYPDGTVLVVRRMGRDELRAGMVVVFIGDGGRPVAHTLMVNSPRGWLAQGLGNESPDRTLVRSQNYLGTVVRAFVPFMPDTPTRATTVGSGEAEKSFGGSPRAAVTVALNGT